MGTIQEHTEAFDSVTYRTKTFPAMQGNRLQVRIARLLAASPILQSLMTIPWEEIGKALDSDALPSADEEDATVSFRQVLMQGFIEASRAVEPDEFASLCRDLLTRTECDSVADSGEPGLVSAHFDTHFAGRLLHQSKVCLWVAHRLFSAP